MQSGNTTDGLVRGWTKSPSGPSLNFVSRSRDIAHFLVFQLAYFIAYRHAMSLGNATASPFWYPDAVLLCALLVTRQVVDDRQPRLVAERPENVGQGDLVRIGMEDGWLLAHGCHVIRQAFKFNEL